MNPETGLPEVVEDKCVACGACAKACPRHIIEMRLKGIRGRRMIVECVNKDKGSVVNKACAVGCIACGKCFKVCEFGAITIENNLSYIDALPALLAGLFWKRANREGVIFGTLGGFVTLLLTSFVWKNPLGVTPLLWSLTGRTLKKLLSVIKSIKQ